MIFKPTSEAQPEDLNGQRQNEQGLTSQPSYNLVNVVHSKHHRRKNDWDRRRKKLGIMAIAAAERRLLIPYGWTIGKSSTALNNEIEKADAAIEGLLGHVSDPLLSCDYYNYILPSLKRLEILEIRQKAIDRKIRKIASAQAAALGLKQTLVHNVLSKVFKSHPLVLAKLLSTQEKYKNFSAESMVAMLRKATVQIGKGIARDREPGERFFDRVLIAFLASWVAFGMQPVFSEKLGLIFFGSNAILEAIALVLAYGTAWSFYEVARRSIIEHFVNLDPTNSIHWKETIWLLAPVLVEVCFVLSWSLQSRPYTPDVNPILLWTSTIIGSAFGASTLTYWARSLAPKVRKHREEFDRAQAEQNELASDKTSEHEARDQTLDEDLPDIRKASKQIQSLTTRLKMYMKTLKELDSVHKSELKYHAAIVSDWRKRIRFQLVDLEYQNLI